MTSAKPSRRMHSTSVSSHTTESSSLSNHNNSESETVLMAKKFSNISLVEREERQQALDRLEILKTVSESLARLRPELGGLRRVCLVFSIEDGLIGIVCSLVEGISRRGSSTDRPTEMA